MVEKADSSPRLKRHLLHPADKSKRYLKHQGDSEYYRMLDGIKRDNNTAISLVEKFNAIKECRNGLGAKEKRDPKSGIQGGRRTIPSSQSDNSAVEFTCNDVNADRGNESANLLDHDVQS